MQAFLKYGKENFECHILESVNNVNTICDNLLELNQSEKYYIDYYNCVADSYYYNMKRCGDGGCDHQTQTTKEKIGKYSKGKIHCSCPMCSAKTNRHDKKYGYKASDRRKLGSLDYSEE